jgi:hypothetical protein
VVAEELPDGGGVGDAVRLRMRGRLGDGVSHGLGLG